MNERLLNIFAICFSLSVILFMIVKSEAKHRGASYEGATMWCMKCHNDLSECTCADIGNRLKAASQSGLLAYTKCLICGKHYELCKCATPKWGIEYKSPEMSDVIDIMEEQQ